MLQKRVYGEEREGKDKRDSELHQKGKKERNEQM
jgi:hypothetical protein